MVRHPLYACELPKAWTLRSVDDVKGKKKGDCCAGPFGSNISKKYFVEEGVPVIRGNNLTKGVKRFVPEGFAFVTEDRATKYQSQHVRAGDLVFTCWGTLGQVGLIPEDGPYPEYIISNKQLKLRVDVEKADAEFLYYQLSSPPMVELIQRLAVGSAVPGINLGILKSLSLALPPLPTQRRIASILSAYDDMIENNTKRIEILEEMARSLYREWFVHFRFPGHEKVKLVDSELGKIPEGWEATNASAVIQIRPRTKVMKDRENYFVPMTSLATGSMLIGTIEMKAGNSGSKFKNGDTLFARITPCLENGKTAYVQFLPSEEDVACGSTEFIVLREAHFSREMVYLLSRLDTFRQHAINSMSGASGRQRAKEEAFDSYQLASPPKQMVDKFSDHVCPMFTLIETLNQKNRALRQTRDLLLPKLISGELDVGALDLPEAS